MLGPRPPRQSTRLKRTVDTAEPPDTTCRLEGWPELKTSPTYSVRCTECKHKSTRYCVICGWLCMFGCRVVPSLHAGAWVLKFIVVYVFRKSCF